MLRLSLLRWVIYEDDFEHSSFPIAIHSPVIPNCDDRIGFQRH